ncbi:MAG: hypothetical protein IPM46_13900 [Flavobacteriales bacterium]|nr:hypothetical protein [Flavobacteriales bacterium]
MAAPSAIEVAAEFMGHVSAAQGMVMDCSIGLSMYANEFAKRPPGTIINVVTKPPPEIMPNGPDAQFTEHRATAGEIVARSSPGGMNSRLVGNMALVYVYQLWEKVFRRKLAEALGFANMNDLQIDLMDDVRQLRKSIIHHNGIALAVCGKAKVFKKFNMGESIFINGNDFFELTKLIRREIDAVIERHTASNHTARR